MLRSAGPVAEEPLAGAAGYASQPSGILDGYTVDGVIELQPQVDAPIRRPKADRAPAVLFECCHRRVALVPVQADHFLDVRIKEALFEVGSHQLGHPLAGAEIVADGGYGGDERGMTRDPSEPESGSHDLAEALDAQDSVRGVQGEQGRYR